MEKVNDPTIRRLVEEHKHYKPTYKTYNGDRYERPRRGKTLIPPRILIMISNSGNSLQWKVDTLNKRERHYEKVVRAHVNRKYPFWTMCDRCFNNLAIVERYNARHRCVDCKKY
jgi:hypothetical protein